MRLNLVWRSLAVLAVFVYVLIAFGVVLLFIRNFGTALLIGATAMILAYAAWLYFAGADKSRKAGFVLGVVASVVLIVELFGLLADQQNRRAILLVAALTALYIGILSALRKKYWSDRRHIAEAEGKAAHFENPYLIINPKSGDGRAMKAHIDELAEKQGIHVMMTRKDVNVEDIAREAVAQGADVLGVSGGDGSIGAVAKVALEHDLPMVVLPGGTRCHFARDLGLDPKQIADSLAGFTGVERRIDAGEINGRIFLNNASLGLYADIVDHPEYREHKVQVSRKVLNDLVAGTKERYDLEFGHDDKSYRRAVQVLVGVNRYDTVHLSELGHRERLDGGVLQVTAITKLSNQLVQQLLKVMSIGKVMKQSAVPGFYQWDDKSFEVDSAADELVVGVDGEREVYQTPVRIRVMPGALRIFVPAEGERNRRKNPLSGAVVRKTWKAATE